MLISHCLNLTMSICIYSDLFPFSVEYFQGYKQKDAFIATEYPMADTMSDFWNMVYQREIATIVMLNSLNEVSEVCESALLQDILG